jgi:hypothetical protein
MSSTDRVATSTIDLRTRSGRRDVEDGRCSAFKSPRQAQEFLFAHLFIGLLSSTAPLDGGRQSSRSAGHRVQRVAAGDVCARGCLISPTRLDLTIIRLQPVNVTMPHLARHTVTVSDRPHPQRIHQRRIRLLVRSSTLASRANRGILSALHRQSRMHTARRLLRLRFSQHNYAPPY